MTGHAAYEAIRNRILDATFAVDHHLVEVDLAARLEVSRTPVRERRAGSPAAAAPLGAGSLTGSMT